MAIHITVLTVWTVHLLVVFQCMFSLWEIIVLSGHNTAESTVLTKHPHSHAHLSSGGGSGGGNSFCKLLSAGL